jgi:biopolymer transport protein TolQ
MQNELQIWQLVLEASWLVQGVMAILLVNELQIWQLVLEASWLVQGVMAILLVASVASWVIIFRKRQVLAKAEKGAVLFEERFWSGTDLTQLHENITGAHRLTSGMERIFGEE